MKVSDNNLVLNLKGYVNETSAARQEKADRQQPGGARSSEDNVDLSTQARQMQAVHERIDAIPDVREEKVAGLKSQIENGTYQVNGDKVAIALIRESMLNRYL